MRCAFGGMLSNKDANNLFHFLSFCLPSTSLSLSLSLSLSHSHSLLIWNLVILCVAMSAKCDPMSVLCAEQRGWWKSTFCVYTRSCVQSEWRLCWSRRSRGECTNKGFSRLFTLQGWCCQSLCHPAGMWRFSTPSVWNGDNNNGNNSSNSDTLQGWYCPSLCYLAGMWSLLPSSVYNNSDNSNNAL